MLASTIWLNERKKNKHAKLLTPLYANFKDPGSFTGQYTISSSHKQNCQFSPGYIYVTIVYELKFLQLDPLWCNEIYLVRCHLIWTGGYGV